MPSSRVAANPRKNTSLRCDLGFGSVNGVPSAALTG